MNSSKEEGANYRKWRADDPRCVFILVHGLGTYSGRWDAMACFFLQKGIASYAIDLPKLNRVRSYYNNIICVREAAIKENPGKPIFLVGESLGALASFLLTARHPGLFNGLVCISPAFANRKTFGFLESLKMLVVKKVTLPFDSSMCTRDAEYIKKLDSDPREYRSAPVRLIFDILAAQARVKGAIKKINIPVLFLVSGEDFIVDTGVSRNVFDGIPAIDKTFRDFPGMHHSLSIELGRETVFEELFKWVENRL